MGGVHLQEVLAEMAVVIRDIDVLMNSELALELKDWKRRQQFACIGGPSPTELDQLQNWYRTFPPKPTY